MIRVKRKMDSLLEKVLHVLETLIALVSTCVLVGLLGFYLCRIVTDPNYFLQEHSVHLFLQEVLSIVIGLDFVKLLMHMTPANLLEVLIMAIARHIVVGHNEAFETLLSIVCIAVLFAVKRYLIPREELHEELEETSSIWERRGRGLLNRKRETEQADNPGQSERV